MRHTIWQSIKNTFRELLGNKFSRIVLVGIVVISTLFATLYITVFWDPIGNMKGLPVAIVNLDQGAVQGGKWKNYGDTIVTEMTENQDVMWVEEQPGILQDGLENSDYFLACIIPQQFSAQVISAQNGEPIKAELVFFSNVRRNFFLSSLASGRIQTSLERMVNQSISEEYVRVTYDGLYEARDGMADAADGSNQLRTGAATLWDGLLDLQDGTEQLHDGSVELADGAASLAEGLLKLEDGAAELSGGGIDLHEGAADLYDGTVTLYDGTADLLTGVSTLYSGAKQLTVGMKELADGTDSLNEGIGELYDGAESLEDGAEKLHDGLRTLNSESTLLVTSSGDMKAALQQMQYALNNAGMDTGQAGLLVSGSVAIQQGLLDLSAGATTLHQQISYNIYSAQVTQALASYGITTTQSELLAANVATAASLAAMADGLPEPQKQQLSAVVDLLALNSAAIKGSDQVAQAYLEALENGSLDLAGKTGEASGKYTSIHYAILGLMDSLTDTANNMTVMKTGVDTMVGKYTELDRGIVRYTEAVSALSDGSTDLAQGSRDLLLGVKDMRTGGRDLSKGVIELRDGGDELLDGVIELYGGSYDLFSGAEQLMEGSAKLNNGANDLLEGIEKVADGTVDAKDAANLLGDGSVTIRDNLFALRDGMTTAAQGGEELYDGSAELYDGLADGIATMNDSLVNDSETMAEFIAQPGQVTHQAYGDTEHYGAGFAPLFMTLGLWLGSLIIFFLLEPFPQQLDQGRFAVVLGRLPAYLLIGALEAGSIMCVALSLGVPCVSIPLMLLFFLLISLTFILLMQCLHLLCGNLIGKAVAILLLILQLVGSSGTMPIELGSSAFLQNISNLLPCTYTIDGFRELILGGDMVTLYSHSLTLLIYGAVFLALSLICYPLALRKERQSRSKTLRRLQEWELNDGVLYR